MADHVRGRHAHLDFQRPEASLLVDPRSERGTGQQLTARQLLLQPGVLVAELLDAAVEPGDAAVELGDSLVAAGDRRKPAEHRLDRGAHRTLSGWCGPH